jgi:hypothetical protein
MHWHNSESTYIPGGDMSKSKYAIDVKLARTLCRFGMIVHFRKASAGITIDWARLFTAGSMMAEMAAVGVMMDPFITWHVNVEVVSTASKSLG